MKKRIIKSLLLTFIITCMQPLLYAQSGSKVSGVVTDSDKEPMIGVVVQVKNTNVASVTNTEGKYSLNVPKGKTTLVFSYLGYTTLERQIKGATLNVEMQDEVNELDEVVVVGYGDMKKRDLTGAISSVTAESIKEQNSVSVLDAMQGQIAGLSIVTGSGAPGEEAVVRVRGTATFEGGAAPLYVVDGIITESIDDINPEDIASIEVLKDAASASIYGSRSANGVFLISTKRGETKMKVDVRYLRSYSNLIRKMPKSNAAERKYYDTMRRKISADRNDQTYGYTITDSLAFFTNQDIDLQDLLFQTAVRDEVNLSVSGASNVFNYYVNASYLSENGIMVNSGYDRMTSRINVEYNPNNKFSIKNRIYLSYSDKQGIDETGVLNQALIRIPYWAIFNPDGSYIPNVSSRRNPYAVAMTDVDQEQNYKASIYEQITYKFNKELVFNSSIQANFANRREKMYRQSDQLHPSERTTGRDYTTMRYDWTNENYMSYKKSFRGGHTIDIMAGASFQGWHQESVRMV